MLADKNPFATQRVEKLLAFDPALANTSWEELEQRWQKFDFRATISGAHGSGKTTLLDALQKRFEMRSEHIVRISLNSSQKSITPEIWNLLEHCENHIVFLDGEEQLSFLARKRFYKLTKRAKGILVTRHTTGKLPTLFHCIATPAIAEQCVQLLAPSHLGALQPHLIKWWDKENGNIRQIMLRCYDYCAQL